MFKKFIAVFFTVCIVLNSAAISNGTNTPAAGGSSDIDQVGSGAAVSGAGIGTGNPPVVTADTAVLIDAETGTVLYDKQMDKQKYPASTTKVMTALLALENLDLDQVVTIDAETPFTKGARIYLLEGEQVTVEQLINALMVESANDAAVALAIAISGSVEKFADLMNQRAKELGAKNTNFHNPNGLEDEAHLTTAYDLAMIAREDMKNEVFREIVTTPRYILPATNKQDTRYLYNANKMLASTKTIDYKGEKKAIMYEGCTGIKTGYTKQAGNCLITSAKRGDMELIAVLLDDNGGLYVDATALLDYGFDSYQTVSKMEMGKELGTVKVKKGEVKGVKAVLSQDIMAVLPKTVQPEVLRVEAVLDQSVVAPVKTGDKIGDVSLYQGETVIATFAAIAGTNVAKGAFLSNFGISDHTGKLIKTAMLLAFLIFVFLVTAYILLKRRQLRRKRERKQAREARAKARREIEESREFWYAAHRKIE